MSYSKIEKPYVLEADDQYFDEGSRRWLYVPEEFVGTSQLAHHRLRSKTDAKQRFIRSLSRLVGKVEPFFDFCEYYDALTGISNRGKFGLKPPFNRESHSTIFPIEWVVSLGHYTEDEIRGFVDGYIFKYITLSKTECIYVRLPTSKLGEQIQAKLAP